MGPSPCDRAERRLGRAAYGARHLRHRRRAAPVRRGCDAHGFRLMRRTFGAHCGWCRCRATMLSGAACSSSSPKGTSAADIKQLPENELSGHLSRPRRGARRRRRVAGTTRRRTCTSTPSGCTRCATTSASKPRCRSASCRSTARPKDPKFQQLVANQVGGTKAQAFVMGGRHVYRSSQRKQSLTSWFQGDYFLILSVRDSLQSPRTLLRILLDRGGAGVMKRIVSLARDRGRPRDRSRVRQEERGEARPPEAAPAVGAHLGCVPLLGSRRRTRRSTPAAWPRYAASSRTTSATRRD